MRSTLGLLVIFSFLSYILDRSCIINRGSITLGLWSSQLFFLLDHGLDTIVHVLDELSLAPSKSSFVRDIVNVVVCLSMLAMSTSYLDIELVGDSLENILLLSKVG